MDHLHLNNWQPERPHNASHCRKSALEWELAALEAQCQALIQLAEEHRVSLHGIDPQGFCTRARDVVDSALTMEKSARLAPVDKTLENVATLRAVTDALKEDVRRFVELSGMRVRFAMSGSIDMMNQPGQENPHQAHDLVLPDRHNLAVGANKQCLAASGEQDRTFAMQLQALCDLALETVMQAVAEAEANSSTAEQ